tara:strand:+ start:333 stop:572 length:240 start_codon:yes stop_codon:yes gene_type:complete
MNKEYKVSNDNKIWNGGDTNKYDRMIRESEDYIDGLDTDSEPFNPRNNINKNMDEPSRISTGEPRNRYRRPEGDKVGEK